MAEVTEGRVAGASVFDAQHVRRRQVVPRHRLHGLLSDGERLPDQAGSPIPDDLRRTVLGEYLHELFQARRRTCRPRSRGRGTAAAPGGAERRQRLAGLEQVTRHGSRLAFGVTRRLLLARHRADTRGQELSVRIARQAAVDGPVFEHDDLVATSVDLANAWNKLPAIYQEALSLSVWEGLTGAQAARVLGISSVAFRIRIGRARRSLKHTLGTPSGDVAAAGRRMPASSEKGHAR